MGPCLKFIHIFDLLPVDWIEPCPVEAEVKQLTASWKPQLLKLLPSNTNMKHLLKLTLFDPDEPQLRWQDLEPVEKVLIIGKNRREKYFLV